MNEEAQKQFKAIIEQMALVYKHDSRPWMIGYSGGKDSTLLCQLTFEMLESLAPEAVSYTHLDVYKRQVQDLYHAYAGNIKHLKNLYSSVKHSIYSWNGTYGTDLICIDDSLSLIHI